MANVVTEFSDAYKIQCRAVWYEHGCPSPRKAEENKIFPPDEQGRVVGAAQLRHWIEDLQWYQWKDDMDASLSIRVEDELLARKIMLIKEQLNQVRIVRNTAYDEIVKNGFDTAAAAGNAFFKSLTEERSLLQIEKVIEDLSKSETSELQKQFRELAERAGSTIINAEEEEKEDEE